MPELERIRLDADANAKPEQLATRSQRFAAPSAPCSSARRWWRRATTSPASSSPRSSTRTRRSACRTSAPRSGPSSCSRSSPAGAAGTRRGACSCRRSSRTRGRSRTQRGTTWRASSTEELERRRALGYPPYRAPRAHRRLRPGAGDALRVLEELKAGSAATSCSGRRRLLRLRDRHRAQLVGKTERPRTACDARRRAPRRSRARDAARRATAVVDVDPQSV